MGRQGAQSGLHIVDLDLQTSIQMGKVLRESLIIWGKTAICATRKADFLSLRLREKDTDSNVLGLSVTLLDGYCFRRGMAPFLSLTVLEESNMSQLNKLDLSRADQYLMWGLKRLTQEMSLKVENLP